MRVMSYMCWRGCGKLIMHCFLFVEEMFLEEKLEMRSVTTMTTKQQLPRHILVHFHGKH